MNTPETHTSSDRDAIAAVQRQIIASMRAGRKLSHAHKEGGTTIGWERDRFVIENYGDWSSRQEFTDEPSFLAALWKRYDWTVSAARGNGRKSELEAWLFILHELSRERFGPAPSAAAFVGRFRRMRTVLALVVLALAAVGFGVVRLFQVRTIGAPFGASVRLGDTLATLVHTQERYVPSLHRNPDRDRFRIDLLLTPLVQAESPRLIPLARSLDRTAFHPGTKLLGVDGPLLWMFVPELKAVDTRSRRVITLGDLQAANPQLGDLGMTARFHFSGGLHLMSADRQRSYTIDPETLRARPDDSAPRITWQNPQPTGDAYLCLAGPVDAETWMAMLTATERDATFRVGSMIFSEPQLQKSREPRTLHRIRVEPAGSRVRITSVEPVSSVERADGALVRNGAERGPLVLDDPASILVTHRTGGVLSPGVGLTHVGLDGHTLWTIDTGLRELEQVLPGAGILVLIGTLPAPEGKVPEPVAVVVDSRTGRSHTRTLRP